MLRSVDSQAVTGDDGGLLNECEKAFASATRTRHAVAFSFGRTALWATLSALRLEPGQEVVLSPLTCHVVPLVLLALKLRPVYADIDPDTLNLDSEAVQRAITPATRAILFQHTYGISAGVDEVLQLARRAGLPLVEDRAQCLPLAHAKDRSRQPGVVAIYSNNLRKPLPAASGGIATTNDESLAHALGRLRDGLPEEGLASRVRLRAEVFLHRHLLRPSRYWLLYRLSRRYLSGPRNPSLATAIATQIDSAALRPSPFRLRQGLAWVERIHTIAAHSRQCVEDYAQSLQSCSESMIPAAANESVLYYFPVRVRAKFELLRQAQDRKIEVIAWPVRTPIYPLENASEVADLGYETGMCPRADQMAKELVGLPTEEQITRDHRRAIVALVREALRS
jgi:perosamine synthetase